MPEDFDQNANRDRHAAWERAHEIGSPTHRLRTALVLSKIATLEKGEAGTCLDAGCGTGEFSVALGRRGWCVTGFDPSEYAIELARHRSSAEDLDVEFAVTGLDDFASDSTFSLVLSVDVLEHVEDDAAAMLKLASLTSPGGALVITVPMDPALWSAADEFSGHHRRYTRESLTKIANGAGLLAEETACYGYPFTRMMWRAKKRVPAAEKHVVRAGESNSSPKRLAARGISAAAVAVTSVDRLFPGAKSGVGLLAVCRKSGGAYGNTFD